MFKKLVNVYNEVRKITEFEPRIALILGSGLGSFAEEINVTQIINFTDIKGFPVSTVEGHAGRFLLGKLADIPIVAMQGRVHYYEGYGMEDVVLPVRLMHMLGASVLILTNSAGGVNENFAPGTLMAITDHIMLAPNPLIGQNLKEFGPRFPDMTKAYDPKLLQVMRSAASLVGIVLAEGVYAQLTGPSYETPAEIKMLRAMGADAVGMSTACEAIAGVHAGLRVCGVSCISNMAAGITGERLTHKEVSETAESVRGDFVNLISQTVIGIGKGL